MSKIESMQEEDRKKLESMLVSGESYDKIVSEFQSYNLNKTNLCIYKKKLLDKSTPSITTNKIEKPEPNAEYLVNSLISNVLICDQEIENLRNMKHQTSASKQAISSLIGRKNESLKQLESFVTKLHADLEIDTRMLMDFLIYRRQKQLEGGNNQ